MDDAVLRADCSACASLCCVALFLDRGSHFAFDKPAGDPCRHLGTDHRCAIHNRLEAEGMPGCARYDCRGAGQRVVALFAGRSWREGGAVARAMVHAFGLMRQIHDCLALLARQGPRDERSQGGMRRLEAFLSGCGDSLAGLARFEAAMRSGDVHRRLAEVLDRASEPVCPDAANGVSCRSLGRRHE